MTKSCILPSVLACAVVTAAGASLGAAAHAENSPAPLQTTPPQVPSSQGKADQRRSQSKPAAHPWTNAQPMGGAMGIMLGSAAGKAEERKCSNKAFDKGLWGAARLRFMNKCLQAGADAHAGNGLALSRMTPPPAPSSQGKADRRWMQSKPSAHPWTNTRSMGGAMGTMPGSAADKGQEQRCAREASDRGLWDAARNRFMNKCLQAGADAHAGNGPALSRTTPRQAPSSQGKADRRWMQSKPAAHPWTNTRSMGGAMGTMPGSTAGKAKQRKCSSQAFDKGLWGAARNRFMKECLQD